MPPRKKPRKKAAPESSPEKEAEVIENDAPAADTSRNEENMDINAPETPSSVASRRLFNPDDYGTIEVPPAPEKVATYDINGPRLMISHIENTNFKSYAGTQTLGPFHKSFTSIVGPNGSGKSNVIDSMLFVFGYRAKKIRSAKVSVLIHNSDEHRDVPSCTVAVYFQKIIDTGHGDDEYEIVPDSKVVVSRTAFRDNKSYYTVDGKRTEYREVAKLLRASGIDLDHNRFLILQGEVEQIAMMKPKGLTEHDEGMLEFLEDIIGSSRFMEPIEILSKRVDELNEIRGEKLNRVKTVEKDKNDLETPRNDAIAYLKMENEIVGKKNVILQKYIHEYAQHDAKVKADRDKAKEGMAEVTKKLKQINTSKEEQQKQLDKIFSLYEKHSKDCDDKKAEFTEFEKLDVKFREDIKHAKANAKKLDKSLDQENRKVTDLEAVPAESEKHIEGLQKKLSKYEEDLKVEEENLKAVMDSLKTETKGLQEDKDKKEEQLMGLKKSVNETKSVLNVAESELNIYTSGQAKEKEKLDTLKKNLHHTVDTLHTKKNDLKELEKRGPESEKELTKVKNDFTKAQTADEQAAEQLRTLRQKVQQAKSSMHASRSRGKVLEAIMAQKHSKKLPGVSGRLGDLGAIDEQYDVAISTACGALDNIVVDTIDTAQKCVEFLKQNNVGCATFIGLDKMARWKDHAKKKKVPTATLR